MIKIERECRAAAPKWLITYDGRNFRLLILPDAREEDSQNWENLAEIGRIWQNLAEFGSYAEFGRKGRGGEGEERGENSPYV